jgi:hypothetical protein
MSLLTIVDFPIGKEVLRLAEMPFGLAKKHGAEGKALLDRGEAVTTEEWYERVLRTVLQSLQRAGQPDWTMERLADELGKTSIDAMYMRVLEISGLKPQQSGEAKAA